VTERASFVKRAPDIAEEILLKASELPSSLRSFSKSLLTKEASLDKEKLELPKRISLSELQKLASENRVDLPNIGAVDSSEYGTVSSQLVKIAKRHEEETSRDILASAAALVASRETKEAARVTATPRSLGPRPQAPGFWSRQFGRLFPGGEHGARLREYQLRRAAYEGQLERRIPRPADPLVEAEKVKAERAAQTGRTVEKAIAVMPLTALGVGTPLAAAALLRGGEKAKKEEVKIYK
jgi:hypothetical protein